MSRKERLKRHPKKPRDRSRTWDGPYNSAFYAKSTVGGKWEGSALDERKPKRHLMTNHDAWTLFGSQCEQTNCTKHFGDSWGNWIMEWINNKGILILSDVIILDIVIIYVRSSPRSLRDAY